MTEGRAEARGGRRRARRNVSEHLANERTYLARLRTAVTPDLSRPLDQAG